MMNKPKKANEERLILQQEQTINELPITSEQPVPDTEGASAETDGMRADGGKNAFDVVNARVTAETIRKAIQTLQEYKKSKANLEKKIIENEQWYKLRHWECMRGKDVSEVQPTSAWLFNCIANKHADAMDNIPEPNILPRESGDREEAKKLTSIIPVILEQNDFEQVYSDEANYKLKTGTGCYEITWDFDKLGGLGDIKINKLDLLNVFWQSGITDIQDSQNLFITEVRDNEQLIEEYPQLQNKLGSKTLTISEYIYDDAVDTTNKSVVVDWYYHKRINGKKVLHYCKFVNDEILFSSENDKGMYERGWYHHAMYPIVFDPLFQIEGTPCGNGYIDIGKSAQEYIDRGNQALMENMLANSRPRYFIGTDGSVSEEEYADMTKPFVHVEGSIVSERVVPIDGKTLNGIYVQIINNKIEELKEVTGNRDVSNGGTTSGVTSASGIASLQEASSKLSRDSNKQAYRAYRKIIIIIIELIRQFYDVEREFRILGEDGSQQFVSFSNERIRPQPQGPIDPVTGVPTVAGIDVGYRMPLFDIEVTAQKQSPYSKMAQNELALQFYGAGFFNPQMADQALACLDMMDFPRKEIIMQKIGQNGTMFQQLMMMQQQMLALGQMVDAEKGTDEVTNGLLSQFGMQISNTDGVGTNSIGNADTIKGEKSDEAKIARDARKRVSESTSPDK